MFKGLGDLANLGGVLKQALEVKAKVEAIKEKLGDERVNASAGGGMVSVVMNGHFELESISISPEVIKEEDREMLETLVRAAVNEATRKIQEVVKEKMAEVAGGLNIPGLTS